MLKPYDIIKELSDLVSQDVIPVDGFQFADPSYKYEPIVQYITSLKNRVKPETAVHQLFRSLITDVLKKTSAFNEVRIDGGFIDFSVMQQDSNPLLFELKPLFKFELADSRLVADELTWKHHPTQVTNYLKGNDYVILCDLRTAYLFNRNAILEFKPFHEIAFPELLRQFVDSENNIWDVIRRIEDQSPKHNLDQQFFEDLKEWYNEFLKVEFNETDTLSKEELIVMLLNKIIFIKTLEDFGLIDFKYLTTKYEIIRNDWEMKGFDKVFDKYFGYIEDFFDDFYDTELFKARFWPHVLKTTDNINRFKTVFEASLGLDQWNKTFQKGMIHYNFRQIDEDVFGKAYEQFIAEGKKDSGIYYTPKEITSYMAKKLVDPLFEPIITKIIAAVNKDTVDFATARTLLVELREIRIIDPTSGSGSFLIKVLKEIFSWYKKIDDETSWVRTIDSANIGNMPKNVIETQKFRDEEKIFSPIHLISSIILHHIHAIDIDERALDTAKTNIWKEAIKLSPKHYNYRRLTGKDTHILPNLELNYACGDSLADIPIEKQIEILSAEHIAQLQELHRIRDAYIANPFDPSIIDSAKGIKKILKQKLKQEIPEIANPVFLCVEFFYCFFDKDGTPFPEAKRGFHAVISNPPWEAIKPVKKEFANQGKGKKDVLDVDEWFAHESESNPAFNSGWEAYRKSYETYNEYISQQYSHQGSGDPNYYKYFIERDLALLRKSGLLVVLVPSGIQTDAGSIDLRELLILENSLSELSSFENRGYKVVIDGKEKILTQFPDVDSRFKFSIVIAQKEKNKSKDKTFDALFYLLDPVELYEKEPIHYTLQMIEKFSPEILSIMEFEKPEDFELCKRIRGEHTLFSKLPIRLHTEFHMTNDSHLFHRLTTKTKDIGSKNFILYEGKMIHQFESHFSTPRYYVTAKDARERIEPKERFRIKRDLELENGDVEDLIVKIDLDEYRLVYRAIGRSTDQLTLISSIVPPNVVIGNSMNYLKNYAYQLQKEKIVQTLISRDNLIHMMSLWNSLTLNYYIRNKVSANLNMFFINELPIAEANKKQEEKIVELGFTLLSLNDEKGEFTELGKQLGVKVNPKADAIKVRAELEILIARDLYGLSKSDWEYLTSTFIYGGESASKKELDKIIALSKEIF
ncbi:MAG: N-6 DNA methylase [bacterium]